MFGQHHTLVVVQSCHLTMYQAIHASQAEWDSNTLPPSQMLGKQRGNNRLHLRLHIATALQYSTDVHTLSAYQLFCVCNDSWECWQLCYGILPCRVDAFLQAWGDVYRLQKYTTNI